MRGRESSVQFEIEEIKQVAATLTGVDADRQAELFGFGVDRKKVRIVQGESADDAAEKYSHGAVQFGLVHLLDRFADVMQRQHGNPTKASARLAVNLG